MNSKITRNNLGNTSDLLEVPLRNLKIQNDDFRTWNLTKSSIYNYDLNLVQDCHIYRL